jgi:hypothetical protein
MGSNVTNIGSTSFYECSGITNLVIGTSVTNIANAAFTYCTSLSTVIIPNHVTILGNSAFSQCTSLTSLTIPDSVTTIGSLAFNNCNSLTNFTMGTNVASIGIDAFNYCYNLPTIEVDQSNPNYISLDGVLFNKSQTTLVRFPGGKAGGYTIPNTVTNIGRSAFFSSINLTNVTMSDNVVSIGDYAFANSTNLVTATIPNSVTSLGNYAFLNCQSLAYATVNRVGSIGTEAFQWCYSLTNVTVGNSLTNIGDSAFVSCTNLTGIYFQGNAPRINSDPFGGDPAVIYYFPWTTGWGPSLDYHQTVPWVPSTFGITTYSNQPVVFLQTTNSVLQITTNLAFANWLTVTSGISYFTNGISFIEPLSTNAPGNAFFRLH